MGQPGFFDFDDRLKRLSDLGDQLETFRSAVDFALSAGIKCGAQLHGPNGRRAATLRPSADVQDPGHPGDKICPMNAPNFSSMTGCRLCGSWDELADRVPDARTIWLFREKLTTAGAIKGLLSSSMPC